MELFKVAAKLGDKNAWHNISNAYQYGIGCKRNRHTSLLYKLRLFEEGLISDLDMAGFLSKGNTGRYYKDHALNLYLIYYTSLYNSNANTQYSNIQSVDAYLFNCFNYMAGIKDLYERYYSKEYVDYDSWKTAVVSDFLARESRGNLICTPISPVVEFEYNNLKIYNDFGDWYVSDESKAVLSEHVYDEISINDNGELIATILYSSVPLDDYGQEIFNIQEALIDDAIYISDQAYIDYNKVNYSTMMEAVNALSNVIRMDSANEIGYNAGCYYNMAVYYYKMNDFNNAYRNINNCLQIDPDLNLLMI